MATLKKLSLASLGTVLTVMATVSVVQASQLSYGESQLLGDGFIRSFVSLDDNGNPLDLGVAFTEEALSLPTDPAYPITRIELSLPPEAAKTAFNHIELDYRTRGFPPNPEIFNVPNFRITFFQISPEERDLICPNPDTTGVIPKCTGDELAQVLKTPEPGTLPEGFVQVLPEDPFFAEPRYGTGYIDLVPILPVINGQQPFTSFYAYTFSDGKGSSIENIVNKAFLETQPNVTNPIKLPTSFSKSGYYPTEYSVTYEATSQEYRFSLTGLTFRSSIPTPVPELSSPLSLLAFGAWATVSQVKKKAKKTGRDWY